MTTVLLNTTFRPESRLPNIKLLADKYSLVTRTAGMAAQFTSANLEYLSHAGNAALRGGTTWWRAAWIYIDSLAAMTIEDCLGTNVGYKWSINATPAVVIEAGSGTGTSIATHGTTLSTATWYFVYVYYDGTNVGVSLNDGANTTTALSTYSAGTAAWNMGATVTPGTYFNGRMQCMCGDNGSLTAAQRTLLYNSGTPLAYDQIPGGISQTATFWMFELDEPSAARTDAGWAALSLTDNNTVTTAAGTRANAASQWNDRSGNANHPVQATQARKPVIRSRTYGDVLLLDGVDDQMKTASSAFTGAGKRTMVAVHKTTLSDTGAHGIIGQEGAALLSTWFELQSRGNVGSVGDPYLAGFSDDLTGPAIVLAMKVVIAAYDGATAFIYKNDILSNSGAKTLNTNDVAVSIGNTETPTGTFTEFFQGEIAALIICTGAIAPSLRVQLTRHLMKAYLVPV